MCGALLTSFLLFLVRWSHCFELLFALFAFFFFVLGHKTGGYPVLECGRSVPLCCIALCCVFSCAFAVRVFKRELMALACFFFVSIIIIIVVVHHCYSGFVMPLCLLACLSVRHFLGERLVRVACMLLLSLHAFNGDIRSLKPSKQKAKKKKRKNSNNRSSFWYMLSIFQLI